MESISLRQPLRRQFRLDVQYKRKILTLERDTDKNNQSNLTFHKLLRIVYLNMSDK